MFTTPLDLSYYFILLLLLYFMHYFSWRMNMLRRKELPVIQLSISSLEFSSAFLSLVSYY